MTHKHTPDEAMLEACILAAFPGIKPTDWFATPYSVRVALGAQLMLARAPLQKAAPDMLKALERVRDSGLLHGSYVIHDETRAAVNAAIAKARGE